MDPNRWKQIDELVDAALDLPEAEREAFITARSAGDDDLKRAVNELLAAQSKTNEFLDQSAMKIVAKAIAIDEPKPRRDSLLGKRIATYRIEKLIGAGGMGEVYLAFDEKMRRNVALKILPAEYGSNDERVRRFEMEARAISKLNHPNIVTIYDVGNFEGINYIATEFVEGKTLRDLIAGKFKLRNVMANSIQICDALSAAHAAGIIHRDIKPENVMIRKDGYAKILDFGVAKLTEIGAETIRNFGNTTKGMIIGTPAYMSPSQVSGDEIDHRTDIWSCGVVLYEFLTGKNPFKGKNRQATFQAILTDEAPPASSLNDAIPENLDRILAKILEKDPAMGYQSAADLRADLKRLKREIDTSATESYSGSSFLINRTKRRGANRWLFPALGGALVVGAIAFGAWFFLSRSAASSPWKDATAQQLTDLGGFEDYPSLSPDKKVFVFTRKVDGKLDIYWQRIGGGNPRNLTGEAPEEDSQPAFSPDGEQIAFRSERSGGGIFLMGATGESVRKLTSNGFNPAWSRDGKRIVFSSVPFSDPASRGLQGKLSIVDVAGMASTDLETGVDAAQPTFSPDGSRIVFWGKDDKSKRDIWTVTLAGAVERLTDDEALDWNPVWSPDGGFIYFNSNRNGQTGIWRIAVDQKTGKAAGTPESVAPFADSSILGLSSDGKDLIFSRRQRIENLQAADFDPAKIKLTGKTKMLTEGSRRARTVDISPDGGSVVFYLAGDTQEDIILVKLDDLKWTQLTNDAARDRVPRFSPDGSLVAFYSNLSGRYELWTIRPDGTDRRMITNSEGSGIQYPVWSPDGSKMAYSKMDELYSFIFDPMNGPDQKPTQIPSLNAAGDKFVPWSWSPDGKRIVGWRADRSISEIPEVWIYTLADNSFAKVGNGWRACWLADSRNLLVPRDSSLYLLDSVTGSERELNSVSPNIYDTVRISKDNTRVVYTLGSIEGDIHMLSIKKPSA
ncbi:MAG: protein kinase [Pyrinomonadaceae bacterium]